MSDSQVTLYNLTQKEIADVCDTYGVELASKRGSEHTFVGSSVNISGLHEQANKNGRRYKRTKPRED